MNMKKLKAFIGLVMLTSVFLVAVPTNVSSEEPEPPAQLDPWESGWVVSGVGTCFEITNSTYLNVTLCSNEVVNVTLESVPRVVSFTIRAVGDEQSTDITMSGFAPGMTYYRHQDGHLIESFEADGDGSYSYNHDLLKPHHVFIAEESSTKYIRDDSTGGDCMSIGMWDWPMRICTLMMDVGETIVLDSHGLTLDGNGWSVSGSGEYGIYAYTQSGLTIKNTVVSGYTYGIQILASDLSTLKDNVVMHSPFGGYGGIYMEGSSNTLMHNTVTGYQNHGILVWGGPNNKLIGNVVTGSTCDYCNPRGIALTHSDSNILVGNTLIMPNHGELIFMWFSDSNMLTNNKFSGGTYGILMRYSTSNTLTDNTVIDAGWGIYLQDLCNSNSLTGNTVTDSSQIGIYLYSSYDNTIFHNNFINNGPQVVQDPSSTNVWETWTPNGFEGNYWSDYLGMDNGVGIGKFGEPRKPGDGVGDTLTPHWDLDWYPLMSPWTANEPPAADAGEAYAAGEGSPITFDASASTDPDGDDLQYRWDFDSNGVWDSEYSSDPTATYTWNDDHTGTAMVEVSDGTATDTDTAAVTVSNVAPTLSLIEAPVDPVQLGTPVDITGYFSDPGDDTHTAAINWEGDVVTPGSAEMGTVTGSYNYESPGVYIITVTVTDDDGGSDSMEYRYVVVYDPAGGFVTGGGWFDSAAGAYLRDPTATGKANFGFVAKYKKGSTEPTGNCEFQFKAGDLDFKSDYYAWLVIAGYKAQFKGKGTINGEGNYGFMLVGIDGDLKENPDVDRIRIKIWDIDSNDEIIYDNQLGGDENEDPITPLGGGQIVIHKK